MNNTSRKLMPMSSSMTISVSQVLCGKVKDLMYAKSAIENLKVIDYKKNMVKLLAR